MKRNRIDKCQSFFKKIAACFFVAIICFFSFASNQAKASMLGEAVLDSPNAAEKQFWDKIKIIKSVFSNQIDDVALAATILYRGTSSSLLSAQYDKNFDKNDYRQQMQTIKQATNDISTSMNTKKEDEIISFTRSDDDQNSDRIDILIAATLVMLDSSGWVGTYSDENYEKALAGDRLVWNMVDDNDVIGNLIGEGLNAVFCGVGAVANATIIPIEFGPDILRGRADVAVGKYAKRFYTMSNICQHGFIGGTMESVRSIKDDNARKLKKQEIAHEIIHIAETYRILFGLEDDCIVDPSTLNGGVWKQYDTTWGNIPVGSSNMTSIGCLITSVSMLIARSGTKITNLPSGYTEFNPGAFVTSIKAHGGVTSGGAFTWTGFSDIAPNWRAADSPVSVGTSDIKTLAKKLSDELSTPAEGKYQKFIVLQIHHNSSAQHWVAVDSVTDSEVYILDPGGSGGGNTLDQNYTGWVVDTYRVMYATDVPFGQTGTSSTGGSSASGSNYCSSGTFQDLIEFLGELEGVTYCNYRGRGENTGYSVSTLPNDPGGATTAFGLTKWDDDLAKQVGYNDYVQDLYSGCTDKEKIDKLLPVTWEEMKRIAQERAQPYGLSFNGYELDVMASIAYGGPYSSSLSNIYERIQKYGKDSYEVFKCFISLGCSFSNGAYVYGLAVRRMAEYELFRTGNYKATRPFNQYNEQMAISNKAELEAYIKKYWPTNRDQVTT